MDSTLLEENDLRRVVAERLGYETLRPGQEEAIRSLLDGRDTLAIMPTGSGKSAIYQIAGTLLPGPTVVISPLIALQRDQAESIEQREIGTAARVNSALRAGERREALESLGDGGLEFLFLAPEQFGNAETLERLKAAKPSLFVVDEAHCISEWGHDFRPHYLRLGAVVEELGHPTVLALTATAAPPVRGEIAERLGMRDPRMIVRGFDRPNLWLGVASFRDDDAKGRALVERVSRAGKPGIVYCATRKHAEEVSDALNEAGVRTLPYHAGLKKGEREAAQTSFMEDEIEVIVATKAFGMGIDKPGVRFVYHFGVSDSVDSYYQEIGRAGRDGGPAEAILFHSPQDLHVQQFMAGGGRIEAEEVERVVEAVRETDGPVDPEQLREETGLSKTKLNHALDRLEDLGAVEALPHGEVLPGKTDEDAAELAGEAVGLQERHREFQRSRLEMMRQYAELRSCYRGFLLNYFGEAYDSPCNACGNCDSGSTERVMEATAEAEGDLPFPLESRVTHGEWGDGRVMRYDGNKIVVLFDRAGYKTLSRAIVAERGLLAPAE